MEILTFLLRHRPESPLATFRIALPLASLDGPFEPLVKVHELIRSQRDSIIFNGVQDSIAVGTNFELRTERNRKRMQYFRERCLGEYVWAGPSFKPNLQLQVPVCVISTSSN